MPDQRLEYIAGNLDAMKIGLDETFRFHCTMCGKCCTGREDILLSPRDIFGMPKELDLSAGELCRFAGVEEFFEESVFD